MSEAINQRKQLAMGKKLTGQKLAEGGPVVPQKGMPSGTASQGLKPAARRAPPPEATRRAPPPRRPAPAPEVRSGRPTAVVVEPVAMKKGGKCCK